MNFHVGQKVMCIDVAGIDMRQFARVPKEIAPIKGQVYTVRGFSDAPNPGVAIFLEEIINPIIRFVDNGWLGERSFMTFRFRPLIERKTDISIFTALLKPTKEFV